MCACVCECVLYMCINVYVCVFRFVLMYVMYVCVCAYVCMHVYVCVAHVHVFWPVPGVSYTMLTLNGHRLINGYLEPYIKGGAWIQCW